MTQANSISTFQPSDHPEEIAPSGLWRDAWRRLTRGWLNPICVAILALYLIVGLLGFLPMIETKITDIVGGSFDAPKFVMNHPAVWFGTDIMGHSVFWQVVYGTRLAMTLGIIASLISMVIGTVLGTIAGYFGGWVDSLIIWLFSTFSSVPWILLVIAIASVLQTHEELNKRFSGLPTVILALSLTSWIGLCRLIRGEVLKLRERDYVMAGRAIGLGNAKILLRHIVPNVFHLIIIDFSLNIVGNVQAEVVLAFLGLGITQKPSWGRMIDDAKLDLLRGVWWQLAAATTAIFVLSLAMNLLGDALRDALDPRLRGVD
jgi:ABC-type dipeptide/oligopeptide/nickel transport system permease subunit